MIIYQYRFLFFLLASLPFSTSANSFQQNLAKQELVTHGREAYMRRCSGCHGEKGDGNGPGAIFLDPKPRDFREAVFKFKTTPLEALPTDEDLMKVISQGVLGTSMPSFKLVPEVERFAIIQYIKTFSDSWQDEERKMLPRKGKNLVKEDFTNFSQFIERAKRGREVFREACVMCHGLQGKGDGEDGKGLEDDWGNPINPANLTKTYIKSGKSIRDIQNVITNGVGGTPMPSFSDVYTQEQIVDLTAFILYLRGRNNGVYEKDFVPVITKEEME